MSEAWKELRKKNRAEHDAWIEEQRSASRFNAYYWPTIPALLGLTMGDKAAYDLVAQVGFLESLREYIGPVFTAYAVVIGYYTLIGLLRLGFYSGLSPHVSLLIAWAAWGWFYYSIWVLHDLRLAFSVIFVVSIFMIRIVRWIGFCYDIIRKGMFFSGPNDNKYGAFFCQIDRLKSQPKADA